MLESAVGAGVDRYHASHYSQAMFFFFNLIVIYMYQCCIVTLYPSSTSGPRFPSDFQRSTKKLKI